MNTFALNSNGIHGNIPVGIGNLDNLALIALEGNRLTGSLPDALGRLKNLRELYLNVNKFSGRIPSSFGNLSVLIKLFLEENNFEGRTLIVLETAKIYWYSAFIATNSVSENNFSGVIPSSLGSCISLEKLHLEGNSFDGNIPQTLKNLRGSVDIDLSRNNLSGKIPEFLGEFTELKHLNLSYNNFEGEILKNGIFKNATSLSLYGNNKLCGGVPKLNFPACTVRKRDLELKISYSEITKCTINHIHTEQGTKV